MGVIKVIGVGGAGCNHVNRMMLRKLEAVEIIAANTDFKSLDKNFAFTKIRLGPVVCGDGKGSIGNPELGLAATKESAWEVKRQLFGADAVFVMAGLGGGTGTGATPEVARLAKSAGVPFVAALVTLPFAFEGLVREEQARKGLRTLRKEVDFMMVFPNERLNKMGEADCSFFKAFRLVDDRMVSFLAFFKDLFNDPQQRVQNLNDLKSLFPPEIGLWIGTVEGSSRPFETSCLSMAIVRPLMEDFSVDKAETVWVHMATGNPMALEELDAVVEKLMVLFDGKKPKTRVSTGIDEALGQGFKISIIAGKRRKPG